VRDIGNIEDWYKNEMEYYNVPPDKKVWDSLSEELDVSSPLTDDNISEWYKKEVEKFAERPDYTVWEKLTSKLDTASVWDKLIVSLNRYDQYVWWRNTVFKGTAIFILLLGSYFTFQQIEQKKQPTQNKIEKYSLVPPVIKKEAQTTTNTTNKELSETNTNKKSSVNTTPYTQIKYNHVSGNSNTNKILLASNKSISGIERLFAPSFNDVLTEEKDIEKNIYADQLSEKDILLVATQKEFLVKKENNKIVFNNKRFSSHFIFGLYARRFYAGLNFEVKKQGFINVMKKSSTFEDYTQKYFLDFGSSVGGTIGWIVSDKLNIETNININSTSGYKRAFSNESSSFKEELNLNYTTVSVLAKRMNNKSTFDNKKYSTNLLGGFYAGRLTSATSIINNGSNQNENYKNLDFGMVVGVEQDRYINKALVITPGIRYQQGLMNIANKSSMFSSSRNFSLAFNLGIKYIFLKKG